MSLAEAQALAEEVQVTLQGPALQGRHLQEAAKKVLRKARKVNHGDANDAPPSRKSGLPEVLAAPCTAAAAGGGADASSGADVALPPPREA